MNLGKAPRLRRYCTWMQSITKMYPSECKSTQEHQQWDPKHGHTKLYAVYIESFPVFYGALSLAGSFAVGNEEVTARSLPDIQPLFR